MASKSPEILTVKPSQLLRILVNAIPDCQNVLITGEPGLGKSEITDQACRIVNAMRVESHPAVEDPTVPGGLPWVSEDKKSATFLPFGALDRVLKSESLCCWNLEDFGNASNATQSGYMQLLLAKRLNNHVLPPHVTFVATTNERSHKTGVTGIMEAVKDRFDIIVKLRADLDDTCNYFMSKGLPEQLIGFLRNRPDLLSDFQPTNDMVKSPSPRGWEKCAKWIVKSLEGRLDADLQLAAYTGCVGQGAGIELKSQLDHMVSMPDLDEIIKHPKKGAIPSQPSVMYAVVAGLAYKTTVQNFKSIYDYAQRLHANKKTEFATVLLRDCFRREPELQKDKSLFEALKNTDLGKLLIEA
jgi:hypothetical protein